MGSNFVVLVHHPKDTLIEPFLIEVNTLSIEHSRDGLEESISHVREKNHSITSTCQKVTG